MGGECGRRVPGYLKEGARTEPRQLVQQQVFRLGDQRIDPTAKTPWKSYPEVKRRVEEVVAKIAATRRNRDRFGLHQQQQGAAEPNNSNPVTAETAHAILEQPATAVQQRQQQQGAAEPKNLNPVMVEMVYAIPEHPSTAVQQRRQQQGPEKPGKPSTPPHALHAYASAVERASTAESC